MATTLLSWPDEVAYQTFVDYLNRQRRFDADLASVLVDAARDATQRIAFLPNTFSGSVRAQQYNNAAQIAMSEMWKDINALGPQAVADMTEIAGQGALDFTKILGRKYINNDFDGLLDYTSSLVDNVASRLQNEIALSDKVYSTESLANRWVQREINRGIVNGESAKEIAARVRTMIQPGTPGGVSYAASRLARTELNNAFHNTTRDVNKRMPWVKGVRWVLSNRHGPPDICNEYADSNSRGLGKGTYSPDQVPSKPHPHCLCHLSTQPVSSDEFVDKLVSGGYDDYLESTGRERIVTTHDIVDTTPKPTDSLSGQDALDYLNGQYGVDGANPLYKNNREQFNALSDYFGNAYGKINRLLRGQSALPGSVNEQTLDLVKAIDGALTPLYRPIVVRRDLIFADDVFGALPSELVPGQRFGEQGYSSTSIIRSYLHPGPDTNPTDVTMEIEVPSGVRVFWQDSKEEELLLQRDLTFEVIEWDDGRKVLRMRVVGW